MKKIECDIIRDLMQNYIDKLSSEATNKLIEIHIQTCKECNEEIRAMEKDVDIEPLIEQNEQINYLKGYKKKNVVTIIATIIITILVLFNAFLWISKIIMDARVNIVLNELSIEGWQEEETIEFELYNKMYNITYDIVEDKINKDMYIKVLGVIPWMKQSARQVVSTKITADIDKIYIENKEGNKILVWDRNNGILMNDVSDKVHEIKKRNKEIENKVIRNIYEKSK